MKSLLAVIGFISAGLLPTTVGYAQPPQAPERVPDITGKWSAAIEAPPGLFTYTFTFKVAGDKVTGAATSSSDMFGPTEAELTDGKVTGRTVTFTELFRIGEMNILIYYTGEITTADEIKFSREVGDFGTETFVAKRVKTP